MNVMMAFGWIGAVLLIAMVLRSKVGLFRNMLVPSSILGGILGFILMNTVKLPLADFSLYSSFVRELFIVSFISIGLTSSGEKNKSEAAEHRKHVTKGIMGMGFVWNLLYALTPVVGYLCVKLTGGLSGMDPVYGMLIPFAFAQGPGQAVSYGSILESFGWENAAMVGVTFAVVGFLFAFCIGVPLAKAGIRRGLGVYHSTISPSMGRGYFDKNEQTEKSTTTTTHSGNIDTFAFHMALVGVVYVVTYLLTYGVTWLIDTYTESTASASFWGMMFITGMCVSYLAKWIMRKMGVAHLHDNGTQKRITGLATDFLIVASFMMVQLSVVIQWAVPILATCAVVGALTFFICLYFGKRFGSANDFERTLGLFGTCTGTVPTGIALVRIVDPNLSTSTAVELGAMNLPMMLAMVTVGTILSIAEGTLGITRGLLLLLAPIPIYLAVIKVFKAWGKKTYTFKKKPTVEGAAKEESI